MFYQNVSAKNVKGHDFCHAVVTPEGAWGHLSQKYFLAPFPCSPNDLKCGKISLNLTISAWNGIFLHTLRVFFKNFFCLSKNFSCPPPPAKILMLALPLVIRKKEKKYLKNVPTDRPYLEGPSAHKTIFLALCLIFFLKYYYITWYFSVFLTLSTWVLGADDRPIL